MKPTRQFLWTASLSALFCVTAYGRGAEAAGRAIPRPLAGHPGNIFLCGEQVVVERPSQAGRPWRAVDCEGNVVARGNDAGRVDLERLPVGYYEVFFGDDKQPSTVGVIAPLAAATPLDSPICCDVATAWFYSGDDVPAAANLCALAGMNWVRDRLAWPEMEPRSGEFADSTRYDVTARQQSAAGLQVLQVNHSTPRWAGPDGSRFPADLRDAYRFCRAMARRWKGEVRAFEPWNEADWPRFGGHTGAEIASMQKACYWGLKAGNREVIVGQNVFAAYTPAIMDDFHANRPWPYFDTLNFHHYRPLDQLPDYYARFRELSAGRPMWITECNLPVRWSGDAKLQEPTAEDQRENAHRLVKIFAISLHEGSSATFWFLFPHYTEGQVQFGVVRRDLTPRPAYLSLAAVGRLLAAARPLGKLRSDGTGVQGYLFRAKPDGADRVVLVAWADGESRVLDLPAPPLAVFDYLGRRQPHGGDSLKVSTPVLAVLPTGSEERFARRPPPSLPAWAAGKPSPVVLQAVWPQEKTDWRQSAYRIAAGRPATVPVSVYNFGPEEVEGRLSLSGPEGWKLSLPETVRVGSQQRVELALGCDLPRAAGATPGAVTIRGDFGTVGAALLSLRLLAGGEDTKPQ